MEFNGSGGLAGFDPFASAPNTYAANNAAYNANQAAAAQAGQFNPFAQSGGFGAMTDYYSKLGAAYTGATGGNIFGGGNNDPFSSTPGANPSGVVQRGPDLPNLSPTPDPFGGSSNGLIPYGSNGQPLWNPSTEGGSNFADRFNAAPPIDYRLQPTPVQQLPQGIYDGMFAPTTPRSVIGTPIPEQPDPMTGVPVMNASRGYVGTGGQGTSWGGASGGPLAGMSAADTAAWLRAMQGAGRGDEANSALAPFGGANPNTFGYPGSGNLADTPSGAGGIGSDTMRDRMAWTLAQSSPFATAGAPANGPYPNLGYNPGMANSFANPAMQQYDWTANNAKQIQDMQDALKTIDSATGQKPAEPYGGALPPFWQWMRDVTGAGPAQPLSQGDTWTNRS